jgi:hypothetical protein
MSTSRALTATAVIVGLFAAVAASPSDAAKAGRGPYDGLWSVSIITRSGPCDPSYRYPARIVGGRVTQVDNDYSYQISGTVNASGSITVAVSKAGGSATGYGRLSGSHGGGVWRTDGGQCAGSWSAARRG